MRLRVYRDIKGASWCGTANLDEGELGDGEGRWALRLGGPCLLLVLLPALVLMVDKLQVVLHQVHVFREVSLIQPWNRDIQCGSLLKAFFVIFILFQLQGGKPIV